MDELMQLSLPSVVALITVAGFYWNTRNNNTKRKEEIEALGKRLDKELKEVKETHEKELLDCKTQCEKDIHLVQQRSDEKDKEHTDNIKALETKLEKKASDLYAQAIHKEFRAFAERIEKKIDKIIIKDQ